MKSHLPETLYKQSPKWAQNILVTMMGFLEHSRRYHGCFGKQLEQLRANKKNCFKEQESHTEAALQRIINEALLYVPYYRSLGINEKSINEFPILDRSTVADQTNLFLSEKYNKKELLTLFTGGSTGSPLKVYISRCIRQRTYAFWANFYDEMNFKIGDKKASFVGRLVQDPQDDTPPFWRYNLLDKQLIFSSYHLTPKNIDYYVKKLNSFKPTIIEGYPNSIIRIAEYIKSKNIELSFTPNGLSTSSENFTNAQRQLLEEAFKTRVFDQYGSAESVVFASDCKYGEKHIAPEYGLIEILGSDGSITREGEGEFLATTLINDAMPLIRYRIGDIGKIQKKTCKCGKESYVIEKLFGKSGAVVVSGEKKVPTAALAIAFEYVENIKKSQIVQNQPNKIEVYLSVNSKFNKENEEFVLWELRKMLGDSIDIVFFYKDDIPPLPNGKYQMVIQNYYK
ncbi:coenzyme F390 synthetase [Marinobacter santoriniensis NKSG1]|uniref:Coenzyme F390 synthetase n=1 Tax=Marinobacter santoriniensis NKSG1 TaxID=1288826 RepID=M7DD24_9GAMM|nr:phenylacetate--CoA ligase family protein [Marinobacter santoriniensis]EMP55567.1 coenzyme F390 synthetase [Marinobacter santoriniensis NKSG1]